MENSQIGTIRDPVQGRALTCGFGCNVALHPYWSMIKWVEKRDRALPQSLVFAVLISSSMTVFYSQEV